MSFGFSVGDFIAVGQLARQLYQDVYKVARSAPQELKGLESELGQLSSALNLLTDEVQNADSLLCRSGPDRIRMVNQVIHDTSETLAKLKAFAEKHELVKATPDSGRSRLKRSWDKLKFSGDARAIDAVRGKLVYHYSVIQLVLTSTANSSLERFDREQAATRQATEDIKTLLERQCVIQTGTTIYSREPSQVTTLPNNPASEWLAEQFMRDADHAGGWASVGIGVWIEAAKYWLLKHHSQAQFADNNTQVSSRTTIDLLKACWILLDVVSIHPQRAYTTNYDQARAIRALSTALRISLTNATANGLILTTSIPEDDSTSLMNLRVLPSQTMKLPELHIDVSGDLIPSSGSNVDESVSFCCVAHVTSEHRHLAECILTVVRSKDAAAGVAVVGHTVDGSVIFQSLLTFGPPSRSFVIEAPEGDSYRSFKYTRRDDLPCQLQLASIHHLNSFTRAMSDLMIEVSFAGVCKPQPGLLLTCQTYAWCSIVSDCFNSESNLFRSLELEMDNALRLGAGTAMPLADSLKECRDPSQAMRLMTKKMHLTGFQYTEDIALRELCNKSATVKQPVAFFIHYPRRGSKEFENYWEPHDPIMKAVSFFLALFCVLPGTHEKLNLRDVFGKLKIQCPRNLWQVSEYIERYLEAQDMAQGLEGDHVTPHERAREILSYCMGEHFKSADVILSGLYLYGGSADSPI